MWSRYSLFLRVRIKIGGFIPSIYVSPCPVSSLLLSADSLMSLLPGAWGAWARQAADTIHRFILALMRSEPQEFAHIELSDGGHDVYVDIKTAGPRLWHPQVPYPTSLMYGAGFLARLIACVLGMCAAAMCFSLSYPKAMLCGAIAALIYTFIRPLVEILTLGFNMLLFGLVSVFTDGLLILWASAWTNNIALGYWESVAAAIMTGIFFAPYAYRRRAGL